MKGGGYGLVGDLIVGIIGALLGGWLFGLAGVGAGFSAPHGATPSLSANGTADAIVWAINADSSNAVLYAYDATNVANELYDISQAGTRD